jgi:hypothetical protein
VHSENPKIAENFRSSWQYTEGGYGMVTYMKTATWMHTLDRLVGRKTMDEILKTYFERWRFKHPCAKDFIAIVNEKVAPKHDPDLGENMNWFFEQVLYGSDVCDYKIAPPRPPKGEFVKANGKQKAFTNWRSEIVVERLGEVIMPVEVAVHFEDDSEISVYWDGKERSTTFSFNRPSKVLWAKIDPEHKLLIDVNYLNNSVSEEAPSSPFWKYFAKFLFCVQNLL